MSDRPSQTNVEWILQPQIEPPTWFLEQVQAYTLGSSGRYAAQLLWQRGIQDGATLAQFVDPQNFKPSSPFEFGWEMQRAVERILHAASSGEKVAIWGDFDADGITSTCVLWDGLGEFFPQDTQLIYYIPNRFTESHGLNIAGINQLAKEGINLIVTCDTGSTNLAEINHANELGIDVIITDHHTLLDDRPPVVAIINPRYLPPDHSMYHLSGVAVAYKLIEALYLTAPNIPQAPLEQLLDLVAIGLIADLVELKGDCRYLAQIGLKHLEKEFKKAPSQWRRPGVGRLLELCQKTGDRPTDISFGIGPRINAVSRIHGDAAFCVELLTSRDIASATLRDRAHCQKLASEAELANARRQELQKNVLFQAKAKLEKIDLSTTKVIVLEDPQWPVGVLGLVAGQIAQEYGCPTILLTTDRTQESMGAMLETPVLARGSARSVHQIDLYQLVKNQAHLLDRFGGHPFAAGLSLPAENIPLFTDAINRELRQQIGEIDRLGRPIVQADIICQVEDLGISLFRELKILEPCGMGNPSPKILIQNCWFEKVWNQNIKDNKGRKISYIKTYFTIKDDSSDSGLPGVWWGHYQEDIPQNTENPSQARCDAIAELDYNPEKKKCELRLIAVKPVSKSGQNPVVNLGNPGLKILDYRNYSDGELPIDESFNSAIIIRNCPTSWEDLDQQLTQQLKLAQGKENPGNLPVVVLAYDANNIPQPQEICQELIEIADHLSYTGTSISRQQLCQELGISDRALEIGLSTLASLGFQVISNREASELETGITFRRIADKKATITANYFPMDYLIAALQEEQFYRQYFCQVPVSIISAIAQI